LWQNLPPHSNQKCAEKDALNISKAYIDILTKASIGLRQPFQNLFGFDTVIQKEVESK
jgi:hypothetical protein